MVEKDGFRSGGLVTNATITPTLNDLRLTGPMTAVDLAALIVTAVCLAVVVVMVFAVQALVRTLRELRLTVDDLRSSTLPMVDDLHSTVSRASDELDRVDGVIDRAERITSTVDVASRLTYKAVGPPLIRTLSLVAGAGRATRRLARPRSRHVLEAKGRSK